MSAYDIFSAILLGIVEGITEFLPISSTGHLILLGDMLEFEGPPGKSFEIGIQLGAILAVVVVYRHLLFRLPQGLLRDGLERYYLINLMLAFLPALVLGALLHGPVTRLLFNPWVVSIALIVGGIVIIVIERTRPVARIRSVPEIGPLAALLIGFGQVLAMIPGTSRSGATIIASLLIGVDRRTAAEFSFILAIPTMLAATAYSLFKARDSLELGGLGQIAIGFTAAFVVALITIRAVLALIARIGFTPFAWYRIALGSMMLVFLALRG